MTASGKPFATFIYVEARRHNLQSSWIDAPTIRRLGTIPPADRLYRELSDGADEEITTTKRFRVRKGAKFYSMPPGIFG